MATHPVPEALLKALRPDTFNGRYRDVRAEDWFVRFERYCNAARISEDGQDRILCAGLLLTEGASRWFDQLGHIEPTRIHDVDLSAYAVFKYKFRQRFVDANDSENAFDMIRDLRQKKSVNDYVTVFERLRSRLNNFDDRDAVRFFRGGLKPELRQLVDNHPDIADDDINALIALAERLDKMNKQERQINNNFRGFKYPPRTFEKKRETFPQPMELDEIRTQSRFQSKYSKIPKKDDLKYDETKKNDFTRNLCFYCHQPDHVISSCPNRNKKPTDKKSVNFQAH